MRRESRPFAAGRAAGGITVRLTLARVNKELAQNDIDALLAKEIGRASCRVRV